MQWPVGKRVAEGQAYTKSGETNAHANRRRLGKNKRLKTTPSKKKKKKRKPDFRQGRRQPSNERSQNRTEQFYKNKRSPPPHPTLIASSDPGEGKRALS